MTEYFYDKYTVITGFGEELGRGEYTETIHAEDGTYPEDDYQEGYWYLKIGEYAEVNLLKPTGGEVIDRNIELSWTTSKHGNDYVEIELSLDGGVNWEYLTNSLITTITYPMWHIPESSLAKIRVRSNGHYMGDGEYYSDWLEMKNIFTIDHQGPPRRPNRLKPTNGKIIENTMIQRLSWEHNHPKPQSRFQIEWWADGKARKYMQANTTSQYVDVPAGTFPEGEIRWRVKSYSDVGLASPCSAITSFIVTDSTKFLG